MRWFSVDLLNVLLLHLVTANISMNEFFVTVRIFFFFLSRFFNRFSPRKLLKDGIKKKNSLEKTLLTAANMIISNRYLLYLYNIYLGYVR